MFSKILNTTLLSRCLWYPSLKTWARRWSSKWSICYSFSPKRTKNFMLPLLISQSILVIFQFFLLTWLLILCFCYVRNIQIKWEIYEHINKYRDKLTNWKLDCFNISEILSNTYGPQGNCDQINKYADSWKIGKQVLIKMLTNL